YTCPSDYPTGVFMVLSGRQHADLTTAATNSYAACYGKRGLINQFPELSNGVFYRGSRVAIKDIPDGTSNTFAIGERGALLGQAPWAGVMTPGIVVTT